VRIVLAAADETIAIASRHHARALRAERRGTRIASTMHATEDLIARRRGAETLAKRIGLSCSSAASFREPPIDAGARIAKARGIVGMRARGDARAGLGDDRQRRRIFRWRRRWWRLRRRLLPAAREDQGETEAGDSDDSGVRSIHASLFTIEAPSRGRMALAHEAADEEAED
jgi:hypothetical protein